jgi:hypothetical protein
MSESFIAVPPDSSGKQVDMWVVTAPNGPAYRQAVVVGDPTTAANVQTVRGGGSLPSSSVDGAAVVTVRDAVMISNPVTAPPVGAAAFNAGATAVVGVSGAATQILLSRTGSPGTGRVKAFLTNNGSQTVTIGNAVSMTSGYPLLQGASITLETQAQVCGYVASGSASVSYIETF